MLSYGGEIAVAFQVASLLLVLQKNNQRKELFSWKTHAVFLARGSEFCWEIVNHNFPHEVSIKSTSRGQASKPGSQDRIPRWSAWIQFHTLASASSLLLWRRLWEAVAMAQVTGFLQPTWETWIEQGLSPSPVPAVAGILASKPASGSVLFLCHALSLCFSHKQLNK